MEDNTIKRRIASHIKKDPAGAALFSKLIANPDKKKIDINNLNLIGISQQTNSLVNIGDIILIKTPLPIDPNKTTILGYEVITKDIIDFKDWVGASFAIASVISIECELDLVTHF